MNRQADFTIKGFLYQFNKTVLDILDAGEHDEITVEGVIEDIDVKTKEKISAIQCKYHETVEKYNPSSIYKPLFQMICHYIENKGNDIHYILYAHYPNETVGNKVIDVDTVHEALRSQNIDYIVKYISKIKPPKDDVIKSLLEKRSKTTGDKAKIKKYYKENELDPICDIKEFLSSKFTFTIGESYEKLSSKVKMKLEIEKFTNKDVEELFYPNAIQKISEISIIHDAQERITTKKKFVDHLKKVKTTAITRWTKELTTYERLLKSRRIQLKSNLNVNSRRRYFIMDPEIIDDFDECIVNFIKEYIDKYHYKIKLHNKTPIFLIDCDEAYLGQLEERLYFRKIKTVTGILNDNFHSEKFFEKPQRKIEDDWREFDIRLGNYNQHTIESININKCDDLFIIGEYRKEKYDGIDKKDINLEVLEVGTFNELKYLFSMTGGL